MSVTTTEGCCYEGVLFSVQPAAQTTAATASASNSQVAFKDGSIFDIVLKSAEKKASANSKPISCTSVTLKSNDISSMSIVVLKKLSTSFKTDSAIRASFAEKQKTASTSSLASLTSVNGSSHPANASSDSLDASSSASRLKDRRLKKWVGVGSDESLEEYSLSSSKDRRCDAAVSPIGSTHSGSGVKWDQFEANQKLFGVTTSYDENLYTIAVDKNSKEYLSLESKAEALAHEITHGTVGHHSDEEGDYSDEETKFSAVARSTAAAKLAPSAADIPKPTALLDTSNNESKTSINSKTLNPNAKEFVPFGVGGGLTAFTAFSSQQRGSGSGNQRHETSNMPEMAAADVFHSQYVFYPPMYGAMPPQYAPYPMMGAGVAHPNFYYNNNQFMTPQNTQPLSDVSKMPVFVPSNAGEVNSSSASILSIDSATQSQDAPPSPSAKETAVSGKTA